jgi:catechol 2,3-dioxygenase-like lactoylglutathione lyase family enzyme
MTKLSHIIEFVADMDRAVAFYRDAIGLPPKFQSPEGASLLPGRLRSLCIRHRTRTLLERLSWGSACLT